jgi:hypothetical protein
VEGGDLGECGLKLAVDCAGYKAEVRSVCFLRLRAVLDAIGSSFVAISRRNNSHFRSHLDYPAAKAID